MRPSVLALGLLGMVACNASEIGPAPTGGDGKTSVFLTDAPFPFDDIERVDVYVKQIALSETADTSDGAPDWVVVASPERAFNLLDLQNGSTALLGEAEIPPGQYRAVRLTFDPARSTMTDADGNVVRTADPGSPGIHWQAKGDLPQLFALVEEAMAIDENGEEVVIDFDVGRSFLYDGAGSFTFIPFLRAITRAGSGSITGTLKRAADGSAIPHAVVSVHIAPDSGGAVGPLLATARSDDDGAFVASFLRPGRYQLVAEDLLHDVISAPTVVQIKAGQTTAAGDIAF